jgi:site-specific DNA-methyltransferase (adenine-specific)
MIELNTVIQGDCLEVMKDIPDKCIDAIICDPPYGTTSIKWDECLDFSKMWDSYERILVENGTVVLFGSGIFSSKLICSKESWYKYTLIWRKSKCGSPLLAKYRPMIKHEDVCVFTKKGKKHKVFNPTLLEGKPYKRNNVGIKLNNHGYGLKQVTTNNEGTRYSDSILDFPQRWRRQDQIHPTQKPVELMEFLIRTYTNEGDMVLDNCAGSFTTAIACENLKRNWIGIELEEKYCRIGRQRILDNRKSLGV